MFDVVIVGGGPAGLSAALVLGRARRNVIVLDTGKPRNARSHGMHGYLTRDGILPSHFLQLAKSELVPYAVECRESEATAVTGCDGTFVTTTDAGETFQSRKLLIATGLIDRIPVIKGIDALYGSSVFHCPYCDGWESRDMPIAVIGKRRNAIALSVSLTRWSSDVTLLTNGLVGPTTGDKEILERHGVKIVTLRVVRLVGSGGKLERIVFQKGEAINAGALFISYGYDQHSLLANHLGCAFTRKGVVRTNRYQMTSTPGVYVIGDAARDVQMVIVAAAEGAKAAVAINTALQEADG